MVQVELQGFTSRVARFSMEANEQMKLKSNKTTTLANPLRLGNHSFTIGDEQCEAQGKVVVTEGDEPQLLTIVREDLCQAK